MLTGAAHGDDRIGWRVALERRSPQGNRLTGAPCLLGAVGAEASENEVALEYAPRFFVIAAVEPPLDPVRTGAGPEFVARDRNGRPAHVPACLPRCKLDDVAERHVTVIESSAKRMSALP